MKQEVKLVSRWHSVSLFHRPFSWWKSGHNVLPNSREDQFQKIPAQEAALRAPLLGSLSSLPPFIREITFFSRSWIVHPHAGLSLSLPMSKFCLSLVFSSNGSAGHNCTIAATFHVFKGLWSTFTPPRACTYRFWPRCAFFSTISSPSVTRRMRGKNESLCPPRTWAAQWSSPT